MWAIFSLTASAQNTNQNVRSLSLKECIDLALAHNMNIQIDRYTLRIANYLLKAAYGVYYDPVLDVTAKRTFTDQPAQFNPKKWSPPASLAGVAGLANTI